MAWKRVFTLSLLILAAAGCSRPGGPTPRAGDLEPITLSMGYRPDVQFAPIYMAVEGGFAEEAGLWMEFKHLPETDALELVAADEIQFAIVSGEQVLLAREQGLPVVYVMAWWQDYPVAVAVPAESGITEPAGLEGKKIGLPGLFGASYIGLRAFLDSVGLAEADVQLDSIGYTQVEALHEGLEDAVVIYANNEPIQLDELGFPVELFRVADYVHLASNGLITNEKTVRENPQLVRRMVWALVQGIDQTIEHPDEAFEVSKLYVEGLSEANQSVQRRILDESIAFWIADRTGYSESESWENMQRLLVRMGLLSSPLELEAVYTNEFVP
jgi:NitT/TauT family transport system substrate-binding protein